MIFQQVESMGAEGPDRALLRKITPSLVTLLAAEPEIQYVALRNINIIVDKYPGMLSHEVKVRLLDTARVPPCLEPASTRPLRRPPFGTAPVPVAQEAASRLAEQRNSASYTCLHAGATAMLQVFFCKHNDPSCVSWRSRSPRSK